MTTYCYPYKRGTGWRSQGFRAGKGSPFNPAGGHTGFDQAMDAGTPIYAPGDGIIRNSGWLSDNYLANDWWLTAMGGDTLVIDCFGPDGTTASGPTFVIAHLQDSTAPVGKRVRKGEQIGISGNSGTATTGAHAHIEALPPNWDWNNGVYGRVDPELYFTEYPDELGTITAQGAASGPQQTKEDTLSAAEVKAIKEHITAEAEKTRDYVGALVVSGYKVGKQAFPGTSKVDITNQQTIRATLALVQQLAAGGNLTPEQVETAVAKALRENTVDVDITVNGKPEVA